MSKTTIVLINGAVIGMAVLVLGAAYYYFGNHNFILSRSYFLEKEIRNLHYFETHEEVPSYKGTAKRYREILKVIRFADTSEKLDQKYQQAVERAELKAKICHLLDDYMDHQHRESLSDAHRIYNSIGYEGLYEFGRINHRNILIDEEWFQNQMAAPDKPRVQC